MTADSVRSHLCPKLRPWRVATVAFLGSRDRGAHVVHLRNGHSLTGAARTALAWEAIPCDLSDLFQRGFRSGIMEPDGKAAIRPDATA
jgi:hypothetical protein